MCSRRLFIPHNGHKMAAKANECHSPVKTVNNKNSSDIFSFGGCGQWSQEESKQLRILNSISPPLKTHCSPPAPSAAGPKNTTRRHIPSPSISFPFLPPTSLPPTIVLHLQPFPLRAPFTKGEMCESAQQGILCRLSSSRGHFLSCLDL